MSRSRVAEFIIYPIIILSLVMSPSVLIAQETPKTLVVGVYNSEQGADKVYEELKEIEKSKAIEMEGFAIVSKDDKGKAHVYNTRQKNTRWGAVIGAVLGMMVMGPIGAVGGAGIGGGSGWLIGDAVGISKENIKNIEEALEPNTSALVAIVDNKWVADVEKVVKKQATKAYVKEELELQK